MKVKLGIFIFSYLLQHSFAETPPCQQAAMEGRSLEGCPEPPLMPLLPIKTQTCKPGTTWTHEDGCNRCFCSDTGVPGCTQKLCTTGSLLPLATVSSQPRSCVLPWFIPISSGSPMVPSAFLLIPFYNVPFASRPVGFPGGAFPPVISVPWGSPPFFRPPWITPSVSGVSFPGRMCVPGKSWFDGCNQCFCTQDGLPACTLKQCDEIPLQPKPPTTPEKCVPGTKWFDGCNHCICGTNGLSACTYKFCSWLANPHTLPAY